MKKKKIFVLLFLVVLWFLETEKKINAETIPVSRDCRQNITQEEGEWHTWQTRPGVILDDGIDSFYLEYTPRRPINGAVVSSPNSKRLILPGSLELTDDGKGGDIEEKDGTYTAGPFRYNTEKPMAENLWDDSFSPKGLEFIEVGNIETTEKNLEKTKFLLKQSVGILNHQNPKSPFVVLEERETKVVVSPNFMNIVSPAGKDVTQKDLRGLVGSVEVAEFTKEIYGVLDDDFDFIVFFSPNKVERLDSRHPMNYRAGEAYLVMVDFGGTGFGEFKDPKFNSEKLRMAVSLDTHERGVYSGNLVHELNHYVGAYLYAGGLSDGSGHFNFRSSVGSLIGGYQFIGYQTGDSITVNCNEGMVEAEKISPLEEYLWGWRDPNSVKPILFRDPKIEGSEICGKDVSELIVSSVSIDDIINKYGERPPGQKKFQIGFVAISEKPMNENEMTFYDSLAREVERNLGNTNNIKMKHNWVPIQGFFGNETEWSTTTPIYKNPSCELFSNGEVFDTGNTLEVEVELKNYRLDSIGVDSRAWVETPSRDKINITKKGLVIPKEFLGMYKIIEYTIEEGAEKGIHTINCRLLDRKTGEELYRDTLTIEVR